MEFILQLSYFVDEQTWKFSGFAKILAMWHLYGDFKEKSGRVGHSHRAVLDVSYSGMTKLRDI